MIASIPSPVVSASEAGLSYVSSDAPGISRIGRRKEFRYFNAKGRVVRFPAVLKRIESLVIPPKWRDVWICSDPKGHLQATGRDMRGRKQYRYHARYRAERDQTKFHKMIMFGRVLPRLRRRVEKDLGRAGLTREKVLAAVVRLMDLAHLRVGNEEYARKNQSFGLTTMRDRHVQIDGSKIHFQFRGKSGKQHSVDLQDRRLARIVKGCRDLPGYELFQYLDETGEHVAVDSGMVNDYLREVTGEDITAKDFRTWHGTAHAVQQLGACPECDESGAKRNVVAAIKAVAELLGNRPATCRKYYIHPVVLELYLTGKLRQYMTVNDDERRVRGVTPIEQCIVNLLKAEKA
jgi:DNA topoisomerase-1